MKYIFVSGGRFTTFASIMNNHPKSPIIDLQQQQLLLRMEYEHEKEEFKRQTETMGVARKVKRGLYWYPASPGRSYYNSLNQLVIDITRTENKEIEHSFEFGRPVCFFRQSFDGKVNYMNFIATVSYADDERMVVVLPSAGALLELQTEEVLGVQLYFDETSYRAMFEALEDTIRAKGRTPGHLAGNTKAGIPRIVSRPFPVAEQHAGDSRKQSVMHTRCRHRTRSSGNRKDYHACGSHLRNASPRTAGAGLRPK